MEIMSTMTPRELGSCGSWLLSGQVMAILHGEGLRFEMFPEGTQESGASGPGSRRSAR